ncbi:hypothetical protein VN12_19520 [Pirellula sp. SH-Sr6A]|uniref:hypothetical protein n=1 Tax=Pirellula sp. SH-Sr6A TaxID=1632865 RepID=UPI00078D010D|nr:hypothetical protein [Pirellula sp. SH-Sr6A]AMV34324.1 hypothetical protein VN12_19520 [Pirellula sp. SH-Sr6A]
MADEITTTFSLTYAKGESRLSIPGKQLQVDSASYPKISNTQTVGTTHEALVLGDVTNCGAAYFVNTDPTNYVDIGVDVGGTFYGLIRLMPGDFAFAPRLATNAPYAKANTASVSLDYTIFSQ